MNSCLKAAIILIGFQSSKCLSTEIPAHVVANNDFAIFSGTSTSIDRLIYQNNFDCFSQNQVTITVNSGETYIYILAMGGDPSWYWDKREDLSGIINGKNIATISAIQQSSDISSFLPNYINSRDSLGTIGAGTYSVSLEDIQAAFAGLSWTTPTPSSGLEIPNRYGFGLGYQFQTGEAFLFKISLSDLENGRNGDWLYTIENNEATITGYTGIGSELIIPNQIQPLGSQSTLPVKTIGNGTTPIFGMENTSVTKVSIPNGVTKISDRAFWEARGLQEIFIPNSVTSIGNLAFAVCLSINNINVPDSVISLGSEVFYRCSSLTNIKLSENIPILKYSAFSLCENLAQINIPTNIESIEAYAFYGCTSLTSLTIPETIQTIGSAFLNCINLDQVVFLGNAPTSTGTWVNCPALVLRNSNSSGWGLTFADRPVYLTDGDSNNDGISDTQAIALGYNPSVNVLPLINYLKTNPVSGLYNQSQYDANRTNGQIDILNSPNSYGLYNTNQIHNLGLGGIILNRDTNNELTLNYQILESTDLVNWTTNSFQMPITNAPTNKMFLRVQAVGP